MHIIGPDGDCLSGTVSLKFSLDFTKPSENKENTVAYLFQPLTFVLFCFFQTVLVQIFFNLT